MRLTLLSALAALTLATPAFADTFNSLTLLNGTLLSGTITGSVVINQTTGTFWSGSFSVLSGGQTYNLNLLANQSWFDGGTQYFANFVDAAGDDLVLDLPGPMVGYTGGAICSTTATCDGYRGNFTVAGTTALPNPTTGGGLAIAPEPSSLFLLGSGILGLAAVVRRRILHSDRS